MPLLAGVLLLLSASAIPALAQGYPFSQRAMVAQNIAHTELTIRYGRPVARGRVLFPDLVRYDRAWNPGADSATRLTISRDIEVEGTTLAAGEYSLWVIPRAAAPWTVIFSRAAHVFHTPYPGEAHDALRVDVTPEQGAHMETLAFYFPVVVREDAELRLHWGTTIVPLRIRAPAVPHER